MSAPCWGHHQGQKRWVDWDSGCFQIVTQESSSLPSTGDKGKYLHTGVYTTHLDDDLSQMTLALCIQMLKFSPHPGSLYCLSRSSFHTLKRGYIRFALFFSRPYDSPENLEPEVKKLTWTQQCWRQLSHDWRQGRGWGFPWHQGTRGTLCWSNSACKLMVSPWSVI